jgi:hypothetical protein
MSIVELAEQFVRAELQGNDASHDFAHIERVRALAKSLAVEENANAQLIEIIELSALLHDIKVVVWLFRCLYDYGSHTYYSIRTGNTRVATLLVSRRLACFCNLSSIPRTKATRQTCSDFDISQSDLFSTSFLYIRLFM